jgi:carbonic anhydrase
MKHIIRHSLQIIYTCAAFILTPSFVFAQSGVSADEALTRLKQGNERFVKGDYKTVDHSSDRIEWSMTQEPYAIILACSDSRVAPEIVFDESIGRLFIIRLAGNVVDSAALGSIEYAAEHLHSKLLVILGHESCGAVKAALAKADLSPNINSILAKIKPALKPNTTLDEAIDANVLYQMKRVVGESSVLRGLINPKSLEVAGAVYDFKTGKVSWLK